MKADDLESLRRALSELPEERPEASLWPDIAQALAREREQRRWPAWSPLLAMAAAALMLVLLLPGPGTPEQELADPLRLEIASLRMASQAREQTLSQRRARGGYSDALALLEHDIESALELTDARLSVLGDAPEAAVLWRSRVRLLDTLIDLTELEQSSDGAELAAALAQPKPSASPIPGEI